MVKTQTNLNYFQWGKGNEENHYLYLILFYYDVISIIINPIIFLVLYIGGYLYLYFSEFLYILDKKKVSYLTNSGETILSFRAKLVARTSIKPGRTGVANLPRGRVWLGREALMVAN